MKILCIGAGAIGIAIGGSLAGEGADVYFLVKPDQKEKLATHDLIIFNQESTNRVKNYITITNLKDSNLPRIIDCIVIAVKAFDTDRVISQIQMSDLRFHSILCLQNGVENEDKLKSEFPDADIIGASVISAVSKLGDNQVRIEKNRGIGLSGSGIFIEQIISLLGNAGLKPKRYDNLKSMKWSKMISNLFANATSGILDMTPKEIYSRRDLFLIEKGQILECVDVMKRLDLEILNLPGLPLKPLVKLIGIAPNWILQPVLIKLVAGGRGDKMPSFYLEKMKGSTKSEVDYLNGVVARIAKELGAVAPINRTLTEVFHQVLLKAEARDKYTHNPDLLIRTIAASNPYML